MPNTPAKPGAGRDPRPAPPPKTDSPVVRRSARHTLPDELADIFEPYSVLPQTKLSTTRGQRLKKHIRLLVLHCVTAVKRNFKLKRWYRNLSIASAVFTAFTVFVTIVNPIPSWSKRTRAILVLSVLHVLLLLVIEALFSFYRTKTVRLKQRQRARLANLHRQIQSGKDENKQLTELRREEVETHQYEINQRDSRLHDLEWMGIIADADAKSIERRVFIHSPRVAHDFSDPSTPWLEFRFFIINASFYSIAIDPNIGGFMTYEGKRIKGEITQKPTWELKEVNRSAPAKMIFRVLVEPEEFEPLWRGVFDPQARLGLFEFDNLIVTLRGSGPFASRVIPGRLNIGSRGVDRNQREAGS